MIFTPETIERSYRDCRQISRRAGSNFHAGFLLLPHDKRRAMEAVYAFMRHTDDLADAPVAGDVPPREALAAWRSAVQETLSGCCGAGVPPALPAAPPAQAGGTPAPQIGPPAEVGETPAPQDILPAVSDAVARFHIPPEHLFAAIDGVEMDLDHSRYETFDDLRRYCERVASAVGLACIHIWGFRGAGAFEPARQAGIAMQLTNILRDLKEDAQAGRVYLPLADLRECDYGVDDLLGGAAGERFHRLIAMEVARAEGFYSAGSELMDWLEPSGRRIFGVMMATYRSLLRAIARHPADVFQRRIRLGRVKRIQLAARWCLLPPRKDTLR